MASLQSWSRVIARHGKRWDLSVNAECEQFFTRAHEHEFSKAIAEPIRVVKGLKYGSDSRHRLTIFAPKAAAEPRPVVVYFHGGGFTAGDIDISNHLHSNIGYFFASHECVCVVATYRLLPGARFPDGAEDIANCLDWIEQHVAEYGGSNTDIHAVCQSAGAAHFAMALFSSRISIRGLKNAILLSAPYRYNLNLARRRANMFKYYDVEVEDIVEKSTALALFRESGWERLAEEHRCRIVIMVGQYDSDEILDANFAFIQSYRQKMGAMPLFETIEGHNHVSYALAIGLKGETLGPRILDLVKATKF